MRILDKYIVLKIFKSYCMVLVAFLFLYIISDMFSRLDELFKNAVPPILIMRYYLYSIPFMLTKVSAFSFLISCLYILGALNKTHEIMAIRASGISIMNISVSILMLAAVLSCATLFVQDKVVPPTQKKTKNINLRQREQLPRDKVNNLAFLGENGNIYFIGSFEPHTNTLSNATLFQHNSNGDIVRKIVARDVIYQNEVWQGSNVMVYDVDTEGKLVNVPRYFMQTPLEITETPQQVVDKSKEGYEMMSLKEIRKQIKQFKGLGTQGMVTTLKVEIQKKIADSFNHIFLVLGALPFALKIRRRHINFSLMGMAILFSLIYYVLFSITAALGKVGILIPEMSVWLTNIFFGVSGIVGLADLH